MSGRYRVPPRVSVASLSVALKAQPADGNSLEARLNKALASMNQPSVLGTAENNSAPKSLLNDVLLNARILEKTARSYITKQGGTFKVWIYDFIIFDIGKANLSPTEDGYIDPSGMLHLIVHNQQELNPPELDAYIGRLNAANVKPDDVRRKKKNVYFTHGVVTLGVTEDLIVKSSEHFVDEKGRFFSEDDDVTIRGVRPTQKRSPAECETLTPATAAAPGVAAVPATYKPLAEEVINRPENRKAVTLGKPIFGIAWEISQLLTNTKSAKDTETFWKALQVDNMLPNLGPSSGFGPHNKTAEEQKVIDQLLAENRSTVWRELFFQVPAPIRSLINRRIVFPLESEGTLEPYHLVYGGAAYFKTVRVADQITEIVKGTTTQEVTPKVTYIAEVWVNHGDERPTQRAIVSMTISPKQLKERFYKFGIVDVERWKEIGPLVLRNCEGVAVGKLDLSVTTGLVYNDRRMNSFNEDTETYEKGVDFGCAFTASILQPNLVAAILKAGYPITVGAVSTILRTIFTTDNLSTRQELKELHSKNPLNADPALPVVNILESMSTISSLRHDYSFFIMWPTLDGNKTVDAFIDKIRLNIATQATTEGKQLTDAELDEKVLSKFSELTHTPDAVNYLGFPQPIFSAAKFSSIALWAVRTTAIDEYKAKKEKAVLSEADFITQVEKLRSNRGAVEAARANKLAAESAVMAERVLNEEEEIHQEDLNAAQTADLHAAMNSAAPSEQIANPFEAISEPQSEVATPKTLKAAKKGARPTSKAPAKKTVPKVKALPPPPEEDELLEDDGLDNV